MTSTPIMLSEHFSLPEFVASQEATRLCIYNRPTDPEVISNLHKLAALMELVRSALDDRPIIITSGYRSLKLNRTLGSHDTSQHITGQACDFICPTFGTPLDVCRAIIDHQLDIRYDQLIVEYRAWVHISTAPDARLMVMTIDHNGTRPGLA
jgi:hypothetical protein